MQTSAYGGELLTWEQDSAGTVPDLVPSAHRSRMYSTPALDEWMSTNVHGEHALTFTPAGELYPYIRRYTVTGGAGYLYQLGGSAVFVDKDGNRLYVATLSKPCSTVVEALRTGWTVVSGVRAGLFVTGGSRALERRKEAALAMLTRYGHMLTPTSWVQVQYENGSPNGGLYERSVAELRRMNVDDRRPAMQTVTVGGQVWSHTGRGWVTTKAKLAPAKDADKVVVGAAQVYTVRTGHEYVSLHDTQTGECIYRFTLDAWRKYERKFGKVGA